MLTDIASTEELETVGTLFYFFLKRTDGSQVTKGLSQFCNLVINFVKLWLKSALVNFITAESSLIKTLPPDFIHLYSEIYADPPDWQILCRK